MMANTERRQPTVLQTVNKIIPLLILAFTGWIALSTVESKVDRGVINRQMGELVKTSKVLTDKIDIIQTHQEQVKDTLDAHNAATEIARAKVSALHHNRGILTCDGCHNRGRKQ